MQPQDVTGYQVQVDESDLMIFTQGDYFNEALKWLLFYRRQIEDYISKNADFLTSLEPIEIPESAPPIVGDMARAAQKVGVGPMAAVAGAIAQHIGQKLALHSTEVLIENGGDVYIKGHRPRDILVQAGKSPYSMRIALRVLPDGEISVCTSAGTNGHANSFGKADAAVAISKNAALADAAATALGNRVQTECDVASALSWAATIPGVSGCLLIVGDRLGAWGDVELVSVKQD
jgi:hypothetical protein